MPEIALFYGIRVTMNWNDHNPPHIYVQYVDYNATFFIHEGIIDKGFLPARQLKYVLAWCDIHENELMQNWELSRDGKPMNRINPLV